MVVLVVVEQEYSLAIRVMCTRGAGNVESKNKRGDNEKREWKRLLFIKSETPWMEIHGGIIARWLIYIKKGKYR
jgi:hypothetical protein